MGQMPEELQPTEDLVEAEPVRPLPVRAQSGAIEIWGREFGPLAIAAAGVCRSRRRGCGGRTRGPRAQAPTASRALPPPREGRGQPQLPGRRSRPRALDRDHLVVIEERVLPRWPYRLPRGSGGDGVVRSRDEVVERLLHVGHSPVRARCWRTREGYVHVRVESVDPAFVEHAIDVAGAPSPDQTPPASEADLGIALERMRFSLAVEDDMGEFFHTFKRDPLLGPTIHHKPWVRPKRRPWPWEALCWAITAQLIESSRAAQIQRRIVRRWGSSWTASPSGADLRDVPSAALIEGRAPAELASMDLEPGTVGGDGALRAGGGPRASATR